jgi:hypothetical protein
MNKHSILGTLAALLVLGASNTAFAQEELATLATLKKAGGTVMVNRGKGFVTTTVNARLREGDRVVTLDASSAEIMFNDGCGAQLKANSLMVISGESGCKAAIASVDGAATVGAAAAGSGMPTSQIIGPLLAAGVVFAVAANWEDLPSDQPISAQ